MNIETNLYEYESLQISKEAKEDEIRTIEFDLMMKLRELDRKVIYYTKKFEFLKDELEIENTKDIIKRAKFDIEMAERKSLRDIRSIKLDLIDIQDGINKFELKKKIIKT